VTQDPRIARERAVELLRATLATHIWLPDTEARRLVWAIRCAIVVGLLALVASVVDKGLWNWLDLLVVPTALTIVGLLFTGSQNRAAQAEAERRAQDDAVQDYFDRMGRLLIDEDLRNERDTTDLRNLARGYTTSVLGRVDGRHKRDVIRFLYGAHLITADVPRVVALDEADLTGADLEGMRLCGRQYTGADLLGLTSLKARAEQLGVDLSEIAQPTNTVNLVSVDLSGANLRGADLGGAILMFADLSGADLSGANLSYAHLEGARGISEQQLDEQCRLLEGATMPNRKRYEEWREDREGREEDAKDR
jgi:uncharacterized protein YjbI with pentapeptide repeats